MKTTLSFEVDTANPEGESTHSLRHILQSQNLRCAVKEFDEYLRNLAKYQQTSEEASTLISAIRTELRNQLTDYGITDIDE